jgi:hypothetical protein|tara:strand:- start:156 stop:410 length:255 start_codon:yes stop_codon:yes gene_type:complete
MAKLSEWTKLVQKIFHENKHKKDYKLGDAMSDAKSVYSPKSKDVSEKKHHKKTNKKHRKYHGKTNKKFRKYKKSRKVDYRKGGN